MSIFWMVNTTNIITLPLATKTQNEIENGHLLSNYIKYGNSFKHKNKNLFDVVEIQGVSFQHRWRKGSAMEE